MDVQTLRRALFDLIKFNPKDFFVQGTLTGYNVSARPVAREADPVCYFRIYDRTVEAGAPKAGVTWGKINERQPTGFTYAGKVDAFDLGTGTKYIYAKATLDVATLLWTQTEVVASDTLRDNTTTIGYALLGVVETAAGRITGITSVCENVTISICDLATE